MKIILVIGHSERSQGARNQTSGVSEFQYNKQLASIIYTLTKKISINIEVVYRKQYKDLPLQINTLNPDYIMSLHCNAYNTKVSGTETLYYHSSIQGKILATKLQKAMVDCLLLPDRGIKSKTSEDRGGFLLRYTKAPCVILEPFFIDNESDYIKGINNIEGLAKNLVKVIENL